MKRIAFLIVAFSISTFGLHSSASLGQDFPATDHASFQGPIVIPEAETFPLPPLPSATSVASFGNTGMQNFNGQVAEQVFSSPSEIQMFSASNTQSIAAQPMQSFGEPILENSPSQEVVLDSQFQGESVGPRMSRNLPRPVFDRALPQRTNYGVYSAVSISALLFSRNEGSNRNLSTNGNGEVLASENAASDILGGIDVGYTRRGIAGLGIELRYFGLYPSDASAQIGNNAGSLFPGLNQVGTAVATTGPNNFFLTGPSANSFFSLADTHVLTRQTEINNVEINILKNSRPRLLASSTELLLGFRYFQFGETLLYEAVDIPQGDPNFASPSSIGYFSSVENQLLGLQIGGRSDYQIRHHIGLHVGLKAGIFNNNVSTRQRIDYRLRDRSVINPNLAGGTRAGEPFDIGGEENVKSLLGELDVAVSVQFSSRSRLRVGYRALGVTDIAFASDQYQDDFTDATGIENPNTDANLVLQGGYIGWELAY